MIATAKLARIKELAAFLKVNMDVDAYHSNSGFEPGVDEGLWDKCAAERKEFVAMFPVDEAFVFSMDFETMVIKSYLLMDTQTC